MKPSSCTFSTTLLTYSDENRRQSSADNRPAAGSAITTPLAPAVRNAMQYLVMKAVHLSKRRWAAGASSHNNTIISDMPKSLPANENGPMQPANSGRSAMLLAAIRHALTYCGTRPLSSDGTASAPMSSASVSRRPTTAGTPGPLMSTRAPKASASTVRSMMVVAAATG